MRRKGLRRRRLPEDLDDVRSEVARVVSRQKDRSAGDLSLHRDEIDGLVASISEFQQEWTGPPCVHQLAVLETRHGKVPFETTTVLPDIEHTYELMLEMLGHIREDKGLAPVKMPLFLYPEDIAVALEPREPVQPSAVLAELPEKELQRVREGRRRRLLRRKDWTETRHAVLDRDDWECRKCGRRKDLELYRVDESPDDHDIDAYITLCRACLPPESRAVVFRGHRVEPADVIRIRSQLALQFQAGSIERVGFVLGDEYVVLKA
jgi:hypothetical protein